MNFPLVEKKVLDPPTYLAVTPSMTRYIGVYLTITSTSDSPQAIMIAEMLQEALKSQGLNQWIRRMLIASLFALEPKVSLSKGREHVFSYAGVVVWTFNQAVMPLGRNILIPRIRWIYRKPVPGLLAVTGHFSDGTATSNARDILEFFLTRRGSEICKVLGYGVNTHLFKGIEPFQVSSDYIFDIEPTAADEEASVAPSAPPLVEEGTSSSKTMFRSIGPGHIERTLDSTEEEDDN